MQKKLLLAVLFLTTCLQGLADSFEIGDLKYTILSSAERTVEVGQKRYFDYDLEIPSKVVYNSKTYNVVRIANRGFTNNWFKYVIIPEGVTVIGEEAFSGCSNLKKVVIPNSVTLILRQAFSDCSLNDIHIPDNIMQIGVRAFDSLRMTKINLPSSCNYVAQDAFSSSSLLEINVDESNSTYASVDGILYIKEWSLDGDRLILYFCPIGRNKAVEIPNTAYSIARYAFEDCTRIPSITLPSSLEYIGYIQYTSARYGCSLTLGTFGNCKELIEINIPKSVRYIDEHAFAWCNNIKSIYVNWESPLSCPNLGWADNVITNGTLYVPTGSIELYKKSNSWMDFWNIEEFDSAGIEDIYTDSPLNPVSSKMYDLMGREIKTPTKGNIFISNGKKVLIH